MRVLVTRPVTDSQETAATLAARGHAPVIAPLMTIRCDKRAAGALHQALQGAQGIVFTSANGVRAFAELNSRRDLAVFTVGPASAACARDVGFNAVCEGGGDAKGLRTLLCHRCDPTRGPLVHVAGAHLAVPGAGVLKTGLEALGFTLRRVAVYEAMAASVLPDELAEHLLDNASSRLEAVLFYSPRSAALFRDLVIGADLAGSCAGMRSFCLSAATAQALTPLVFRSVGVAPMPNGQALLDLLD